MESTTTTATRFARTDLDALPPYIPGRAAAAGSESPARLASNESPDAPLPAVQRELQLMVSGANRYPSMGAIGLIGEIAAHFGVSPDRVAVGNGSSSLIRDLASTVSGPGDEIVFANPSFQYYGSAVVIAGATPVKVPLNSAHAHDLDALAEAVTSRTRVLLVCNPNNPTGTVCSREDIEAFVRRVPSEVLVVIDEAYIEFCEPGIDALPLLEKYPNVAVLRTFSKAYGLAGLRIGYLIGPESLVAYVRKVTVPFALNAFAQAAGVASLTPNAQAELRVRVARTIRLRDELTDQCEALGMSVVRSNANFVFFPSGDRSSDLVAACESAGVLVRATGGGVRATVGTEEENARLLAALTRWVKSGTSDISDAH